MRNIVFRVAADKEAYEPRKAIRKIIIYDKAGVTGAYSPGLDRTFGQWLMNHMVVVISSDPASLKFLWAGNDTLHQWYGHIFSSAVVAIDKLDNVNRASLLHGDWRYRLETWFRSPQMAQAIISNVTAAVQSQLRKAGSEMLSCRVSSAKVML